MNIVIAIAIGGGVGALARHFLSSMIYSATGSGFPWGIFVVNVLGGFAMGVIVELGALKLHYVPELRAFLTTGALGGFTTFSTFALDSALLIERHQFLPAALYIGGSTMLAILALFGGLWLVRVM